MASLRAVVGSVARRVMVLNLLFLISLTGWAQLGPAQAQSWPTRTVRIVVPYPAGGNIDVLARRVAEKLAIQWGQPVFVENRPGSATVVGAVVVAQSRDDHTVLFTSDSTVSVNPHLFAKLPYDPQKDFAPVTNVATMNLIMAVHRSVQADTLPDLIKLARAKPGALNYSSYGVGSQPQLIMAMLNHRAGIDTVHVPFRGGPEAVLAAMTGVVQIALASVPTMKPHIEAGALKAMAFGGSRRSPVFPQVPTFAELGFPDVGAYTWFGILMPANTPRNVIMRVYRDTKEIANQPDFREKILAPNGLDLALNPPDEFANYLREERELRGTMVKASGIKQIE